MSVIDAKEILKDYNSIRTEICKNLNSSTKRNDLILSALEVIANIIKTGADKLKANELDNLTQFLLDAGAEGLQVFMELTDKNDKCRYVLSHISISKLTNDKGETPPVMLATIILEK